MVNKTITTTYEISAEELEVILCDHFGVKDGVNMEFLDDAANGEKTHVATVRLTQCDSDTL